MNHNKSTVVEEYHKPWSDKQPRPKMVEVFISVCWYTIDEQPNWDPSMNARKSRVVATKTLQGAPHTVYETVGMAPKLDELWYDNVWMKYVGEKMPRFGGSRDVCRPNTIYDYPKELIEVLKKYSKDSRTKAFVCGTGKFYVESHNSHRGRKEEVKVDPNPNLEEISKMVMLFETEQEAKDWIIEVMSQVKGFTPEQIEKNKSQYVEPVYSDEEEVSPILTKLENYIKIIAANAEHFCKPENMRQLQWAMWRFSNIFYAARHTKQGYEDSVGYFLESFEGDWTKGLSKKHADAIRYATSAEHKLASFGYIDKEFIRGSYICNLQRIDDLQNSEVSEIVKLLIKKQKTFDEHKKLQKLVYGKSEELSTDLLLTYYGGYKFIDGYLVADDTEKIDPMFVYGFKEVPKEIMQQLETVLNDELIQKCQNEGRIEWEKDMIFYYEKQFMSRKDMPKEIKDKMKGFNFSQWVHFAGEFMKLAKASVEKKKDYKLILGIDPIIKKIRKDSHPSYVKAAIEICNKTLKSKESNTKDKNFAQNILNQLS